MRSGIYLKIFFKLILYIYFLISLLFLSFFLPYNYVVLMMEPLDCSSLFISIYYQETELKGKSKRGEWKRTNIYWASTMCPGRHLSHSCILFCRSAGFLECLCVPGSVQATVCRAVNKGDIIMTAVMEAQKLLGKADTEDVHKYITSDF